MPSSSQEEGQKTLFNSEKNVFSRALDLQPVTEKTIKTDDSLMKHETVQVLKKQPKSNSVSRSTTFAEAAHSIHFSHHNSKVKNGEIVSSQSSADASSALVRTPQIPRSFNKSCNVAPKVTDNAPMQSLIFEAFEVATLKTFADIGKISTPDV